MLGLGGGCWYIGMFINLGLDPFEATQTSNMVVLAGSVATVIECILNGIFLYDYAFTLGLIVLLGSFIGIKGITILINKYG